MIDKNVNNFLKLMAAKICNMLMYVYLLSLWLRFLSLEPHDVSHELSHEFHLLLVSLSFFNATREG